MYLHVYRKIVKSKNDKKLRENLLFIDFLSYDNVSVNTFFSNTANQLHHLSLSPPNHYAVGLLTPLMSLSPSCKVGLDVFVSFP